MLKWLFGGKSPAEVFTPRSPTVNDEMYIGRPDLEAALEKALLGTQHVLIHGESGSGKSWLYKHVIKRLNGHAVSVNLANASRFGSIGGACKNAVDSSGIAVKTRYSETKSAEVDAVIASGNISNTGEYEIGQKEPFEACLLLASQRGKGKVAWLVFENLESIFLNEKLMRELADVITLLDDEQYSQYGAKLLIVGVPKDVREYFVKAASATVSNRLQEIPEVGGLSHDQVREFVDRGFNKQLGLNVSEPEIDEIVQHAEWVTGGIPQRLHEYCLELSTLLVEGRVYSESVFDEADRRWLVQHLSNDYGLIVGVMNEKETKVGRRNQVLYSLGQVQRDTFRITDIEAIVRAEFPKSTEKLTLDVSGILGSLASTERGIIKRSPKGDAYLFVDPRYRMCIRAMLRKTDDEKVAQLDLRNVRM